MPALQAQGNLQWHSAGTKPLGLEKYPALAWLGAGLPTRLAALTLFVMLPSLPLLGGPPLLSVRCRQIPQA